MNPFNIFDIKQEEYQLVLVLQNEHACWFRWRGQELMGSWSEPMSAESLNQGTRCPWVQSDKSGAASRVRLVLDTSLDEVDRVKVGGYPEGWTQAVQRRRMARRLHADYPMASIHRLPDYASPDALSIVHHLIPPEWEEWLRQSQSQGACITHAVTSLELLCQCSRDWPSIVDSQTNSLEKNGGPVLFDVAVGNERRHLLVDNGVPLFMRVVKVLGEAVKSENNVALDQSLQHVRDQITHDERTPPVLAPVLPWPELQQHLQAASVLAAWSVGSPVRLQRMPVSNRDESASVTEQGGSDVKNPQKSRPRRLSGGVVRQVAKWLHRRDEQQRWSLTDDLRFSSDFLQPSIAINRLQLRIRQLQKATLICAWMAAGSVVIASTHGINSAREKARLSNEQQQLGQQIDHLAESVSTLNDNPGFVVRSLAIIEAHESVKPIDALGVLATVASVINDFPTIVLDSLSWSVMTDNQPLDLAYSAISQVPQREQMWHADSQVARLQVDISGTITDQQGLGLREQQKVLQSFVDHLQAMPGVAEVNVLEAPVNAARSSDRIVHEGSGYRLSLQLGLF